MKMDRNQNSDGLGKYAVINLRRLDRVASGQSPFQRWTPEVAQALKTLEDAGALEWGCTNDPDEFFLIKLKDRNAATALLAYAQSIERDDGEFAAEVREMASRSGENSPYCKAPD